MSDKKHPSFTTDNEGHHYVPGQSKGNASYFERPAPPVRDGNGFPLKQGGGVDWDAVYEERQKGRSDD